MEKIRRAANKSFIIPIIVITIIFIIVMLLMADIIDNYFFNLKRDEALSITEGIYIDLNHAGESYDAITKLLNEQVESALKMASIYRENYGNMYIQELITTFNLDIINIYNSKGIVEYSNIDEEIGWKAFEDHPVYNLIDDNYEEMFIENIRQNPVNGEYYKFGYIKQSDGYVVQIGVLAERARDLLESVRLQNHLEEMMTDDTIVQLYAYDHDYRISASTNRDAIGLQMTDQAVISDIDEGRFHERINKATGVDIYEIFVPLEYEANNIKGFGIQYSLDDMILVIRNVSLISFVGLIIIYISLIYSMYTTKRKNNQLIQLAYYDSLTGLPNAEALKYEFGKDLAVEDANKAILMIKYDNFNHINASFGYEHGDIILKEYGDRIKTLENNNIQVFKFTDEKFVVYIRKYEDAENLLAIIMKIEGLSDQPFVVNNINQHVHTKIGVIEYNGAEESLDQLLKDATAALNYANISETDYYAFFNEDMESKIQREEIIERELREVINDEGSSKLYLLYQPILDSKTGKISIFEALSRMDSDEIGFVSPMEFIDIAERKRLVIPLSNIILKRACTFIADLVKMGYTDLRVAVNISTVHIIQDDFVDTVLNIIEETGIEGHNLELELTETIIMNDFQIVKERLKELRVNGISISLDDFGTGYSSFDRLTELKVDTLKIDQYFIKKLTDENEDSLITSDLISIAHRLGLEAVAEGVELREHKDYLVEHGCDKLQGYLFSKPVPEEEAVQLLEKYNKKSRVVES